MDLTLREKEFLKLLAQGYTYVDIAKKLGLSIRTLHGHETNLVEKFQLETDTGVYQLARTLFP
ncbi:hypothetical protein GCM10028805_11380 [Spirosoma harenae]